MANIKTGGLILPTKKRPVNIRKRQSEENKSRDDSSDEEDSAPASKIREIQSRQNDQNSTERKRQKADCSDDEDANSKGSGNSGSESGSGSDEDLSDQEKDTEKASPVQPYKPLPQVVLKDPEEEKREKMKMKMEKIVKLFERRNTEEDIEAARERYFMRKRAGTNRPVLTKDWKDRWDQYQCFVCWWDFDWVECSKICQVVLRELVRRFYRRWRLPGTYYGLFWKLIKLSKTFPPLIFVWPKFVLAVIYLQLIFF